MKLNCDMGESFGTWKMGQDAEIMPYIDMANIACGFHASDPQIMKSTVELAALNNVKIGAHPGYPDLHGFGRKEIIFSPNEIINMILYQVGALQAICYATNTCISYIKPHGALYKLMMCDFTIYRAIVTATSLLERKTQLMIMAVPEQQDYIVLANQFGVELLFEAFCDRLYTDESVLQSRMIEGAIHKNLSLIIEQAHCLINNQPITSNTGRKIDVVADTICIHGDEELALPAAKQIQTMLANK